MLDEPEQDGLAWIVGAYPSTDAIEAFDDLENRDGGSAVIEWEQVGPAPPPSDSIFRTSSECRDGMNRTIVDGVRGIALLAVVTFLGVLAWNLGRPGYTHVRLGFFTVLGVLALVGVLGILRHSARLVAVSAGGLFVLGFWQAVLWVYIAPVVGLLVVTVLLESEHTNPDLIAA